MCDYRGPHPHSPFAGGCRPGALPAPPRLDLDQRLLLRFSLHLHVLLSAECFAGRLPAKPAQRLARIRAVAAVLAVPVALPAAEHPLLAGLRLRYPEETRRLWLACACKAMRRAALPADAALALWHWLETVSEQLLHTRAGRGARVCYLPPPALRNRRHRPQLVGCRNSATSPSSSR